MNETVCKTPCEAAEKFEKFWGPLSSESLFIEIKL